MLWRQDHRHQQLRGRHRGVAPRTRPAQATPLSSVGAGRQPTASNNSALGGDALGAKTTGVFDSAVGSNALVGNTTGQPTRLLVERAGGQHHAGNNSAVGENALTSNTTGGTNSAFGQSALSSNTTGISNSAVGVFSLAPIPLAIRTRPWAGPYWLPIPPPTTTRRWGLEAAGRQDHREQQLGTGGQCAGCQHDHSQTPRSGTARWQPIPTVPELGGRRRRAERDTSSQQQRGARPETPCCSARGARTRRWVASPWTTTHRCEQPRSGTGPVGASLTGPTTSTSTTPESPESRTGSGSAIRRPRRSWRESAGQDDGRRGRGAGQAGGRARNDSSSRRVKREIEPLGAVRR